MIPSLSLVIFSGLWPLVGGFTSNREATWSSTNYGPDGPWRAVQVSMGDDSQTVDLYPGDNWASMILLDTICSTPNLTDCLADRAGTFDTATSGSTFFPSGSTNDTSDMSWLTGYEHTYLNKAGGNLHARSAQIGDYISLSSLKVPNVSITAIYEAYQTYPNGKEYPVEVGTLSLGGTSPYHVVNSVSYNLFTGYAWDNEWIDSYSWGMHIGSVEPEIDPSLVLGGFDETRVIGNVSSQELASVNELGLMKVQLTDIGLGVAEGASPWSFESMDNLFRRDGSTVSRTTQVEFSPTRPYLYLPGDTCDAIAAHIPVTFNEDLGLYFWNTDDDSYKDITTSPAYLSFTFVKNDHYDEAQPNITIKVPFNLLKLTLQPPLVEQNTTYFPCHPTETDTNEDGLQLGRAFLQAAFLGENWLYGNGTGYWFFAQAPGPVTSVSSIKDINVGATEISSSATTTWEETWEGWWTPLATQGDASGNGNSTSGANGKKHHSGLSQGAKIGIGIGCGVAGALILCAAGFMIARCMKKDKQTPTPISQHDPEENEVRAVPMSATAGPMELSSTGNPLELSGSAHYLTTHPNPSEVMGDVKPPPWTPAHTATATSTTGSMTMSSNIELHSGEVAHEMP